MKQTKFEELIPYINAVIASAALILAIIACHELGVL